MRMVQRVMLPESDPSHLAEVFLGGLLRTATSDIEIGQYDFLPGVRDELNRYLVRDEMLDVLRETSQFAAERFGQRLDFAALLSDPEGTLLPVLAGDGSQPFTYIAASTLAKLGGRYRTLADRLAVTNPGVPGDVTFSSTTLTLNDQSAIHQADAPPIELEADANATKTADGDLSLAGVRRADDQPRQYAGAPSLLSHRIPEQSASHIELLESSNQSQSHAKFDAILVPTNRPVEFLNTCISLGQQTGIPLIVICSRRVNKQQVLEAAERENVQVFAVDLPEYSANSLVGTSFATSTDEDLLAVSAGRTRDLSIKRNLGLVIAKMLGWRRLMFLSDDIYGISKEDVEALAAALNSHNVSVLIPEYYPDNSVVSHAFRLGGGEQDTFATADGMGVRCDRDDLPFFPNIYNEDWFFFSGEAASRRIAVVGESQQREYDPYRDPERAVKEEFGDLLAEGLYARLDARQGISDVDEAYWTAFKESRRDFLRRVAESLERHPDRDLEDGDGPQVRAAQVSIRAAQEQLERIDSGLCQKFIVLWQADLVEWRRYLTELPRFESISSALDYLRLDYAVFPPSLR